MAPRVTSIVRLAVIAVVVFGIASYVLFRRREAEGIERDRAALLAALHLHASSLRPEEKSSLTRVEGWLLKLGAAYEGDAVAKEAVLGDVVARPSVYVRGPLAAFGTQAAIAPAAAASAKDAFLLCLVAPPASRTERALLAKVRAAYGGAELATGNVRRLHEEEVGLRLLQPAWEDLVRGARDARELGSLRTELERAPLERAKQAARAGLLIVAMDEPPERPGPADLDGERAHPVRVALVDLAADKIVLRLRKGVDPSTWSTAARAEYSSGLDACALAMDVHDAARSR